MSYLLQDDDGQITEPRSISAGLDYPGVGPEHGFLKDVGRAEYSAVSRLERIYNSGVGDITCVAPSGKALSDASRWNQNGLNLRRER
ncbi:hypothetical protein Bca52824_088088 [Brassica carinata]|uniref:Tryptophan synthase n=1 Tax=Brassica carinata TaxID=52824 RepID=A0A8X7TNC7_BRACI|nr:hypothetical protein Bca52824_088088 [Brassica carinata]